MSTTLRNVGRSIPIQEDAPESPITPFRDRIAVRNEEHTRTFPRAATLEAQVLYRLHEEINGEATNLRGVRSAQGFRAAIAGEKNFNLSDLCRLATEPTREARAAAKAALVELANALGYELKALDAAALEAHESLAEVASTHGTALAHVSLALANDGRIDEHEARSIEPHLDAAQKSLDRMKATVSRAKGTR
jgi:hypothetical protein